MRKPAPQFSSLLKVGGTLLGLLLLSSNVQAGGGFLGKITRKIVKQSDSVEGACSRFFVGGVGPVAAVKGWQMGTSLELGGQQFLCFDGFALMYSEKTKTPLYVAQVLTADGLSKDPEYGGLSAEPTVLHEEPLFAVGTRVRGTDFEGSGYEPWSLVDRYATRNSKVKAEGGSLASTIALPVNEQALAVAMDVDRHIRAYVRENPGSRVFTLAGPVFSKAAVKNTGSFGAVPTSLFKAVYDETTRKSWAFLWDVEKSEGVSPEGGTGVVEAAKMLTPISLRVLQRKTGVEWMPKAYEGGSGVVLPP